MCGTELASCVDRFDSMKGVSISTARRPVVLLVQQSRDDGLAMFAAFLRYHGLAAIVLTACAWSKDREKERAHP
jgi:hypothetical protein